ncbi:Transcriptional regulator, DeoR family [Alloactinosynnema sp. L-07]|uniref:helix-turn-helix transcriptional regulator n=1 Tax=Alloactinosynnema sp. L-07 TaxID=1653480 RepID=UPI00065EF83E|nr:WYL domain-containing protein [Alloactinosynnema sp. L-07]CRK62041.1 Transcriptional regulator, DeoR family [Alloactinosynnema sp. L-07]
MRASRLLSILLLLQTRGRLTARELAQRLEVSVRTVYRDIDALTAAGVPLYAESGPAGGYQILDGYRTKLTGLTATEAESLFLAGIPGPAAELGLGAALAATELKLMAALPAELRERAARIRERVHVDVPGWFSDPEDTPHLAEVAKALWDQRELDVSYRRWMPTPKEVRRTLRPLGLVVKAGTWYLVADTDNGRRTYRVASIRAVESVGERFDRPADFDLAASWAESSRQYESTVYQGEALIRLSPKGFQMLGDVLGPAATRAADETATPPDAEGWRTATIPIETLDHAVGQLLRLRAEVEVLGPADLRTRMADTAAAIGALYSQTHN